MIVGYYKNYLYTTEISSAFKKKKKKSQYMVSHPETGSDSPIGSDRDRGRDNYIIFLFTSNILTNVQMITIYLFL